MYMYRISGKSCPAITKFTHGQMYIWTDIDREGFVYMYLYMARLKDELFFKSSFRIALSAGRFNQYKYWTTLTHIPSFTISFVLSKNSFISWHLVKHDFKFLLLCFLYITYNNVPSLTILFVLSKNNVSFGDTLWNTTFCIEDLPLLWNKR